MNAFTKHPRKQGITYFGHWAFASGIALRLVSSAMVFAAHAVLPFISIEPRLDLEATSAFLLERNHFIETAAAKAHGQVNRGRAHARPGRHDTSARA